MQELAADRAVTLELGLPGSASNAKRGWVDDGWVGDRRLDGGNRRRAAVASLGTSFFSPVLFLGGPVVWVGRSESRHVKIVALQTEPGYVRLVSCGLVSWRVVGSHGCPRDMGKQRQYSVIKPAAPASTGQGQLQ